MRSTVPILVALALAGCAGGNRVEGQPPKAPETIKLTTSATKPGGLLPSRNSCDGLNVPPPLRWSGVPGRARELALLVEDPDAPGGTFVHWTVYGIPPGSKQPMVGPPSGAQQGANSFGRGGWSGPCPPKGDKPHRYVFTLYALARPSGLRPNAHPRKVRKEMEGALARGTLTVRFGR
jgi:Raf kinase inhibitor-like YbhB/YbcL family protein